MSWEMVDLKDIFNIARGGSPRPIQDFITEKKDGINWIMIGDTGENAKYINSTKKKIKKEGVSKSRRVYKGDFLLTNSMSFGRPYLLNIDGCIHDGWLVLSPKNESVISKDFFYYLLGSQIIKSKFNAQAAGAIVKNLNITIVKSIQVPLPPLQEQQRIADILDKAEAINQKREQALALCDEFLRATFLDMFGDPVSNPKKWDVDSWEKVIDIKNGKNQKKVAEENGKYAIFGSGGEMGRANDFITPAFSVIIGRKGNINDPILVTEPVWNVDTAFGLVPDTEIILHDYLYWFCFFFDFLRLNKTVTIPSLRKVDLYEIQIPIPPIELQQKFSEIVEKVNGIKSRIQQAQELPLFDALSQKAFKGELTQ